MVFAFWLTPLIGCSVPAAESMPAPGGSAPVVVSADEPSLADGDPSDLWSDPPSDPPPEEDQRDDQERPLAAPEELSDPVFEDSDPDAAPTPPDPLAETDLDEFEPLDMGEIALSQQDYEAAAEWFEKAIAADPTRSLAYYHLAVSREALRDYAGAIDAYKGLLETARQISWRELARSRLDALGRSYGRDLLFRTALFVDAGARENALNTLARAIDLDLPPALDQRARREYYRLQAEGRARDIADISAMEGRFGIEATDFVPASPAFQFPSQDFSRLIEASLAGTNGLYVIPLNVSRPLRRVLATLPPHAWAGGGVEMLEGPVVVGSFGETVLTRLVAPYLRDVLYESAFDTVGGPPPFLRHGPWRNLPDTWRERRDLDPEVWADAETFDPGASLGARFRPSGDCFAAVFHLDEDGGVARLSPKERGSWPFVQAGETVRFELERPADTASTVAAVWAIAGRSQLDLPRQALTAESLLAWAEQNFRGAEDGLWAASVYVFRVLPEDT